jgi:hypothetical protein
VDRTSRAIQGESPPAGFEELYAAWHALHPGFVLTASD